MIEQVTSFDVDVVERSGAPGAWGVEAIDMQGDGDCYLAVFSGRDAESRAREYASLKYGFQTAQAPA